ncbi:unnamed protein product [Leptidea sinapis]|uniref:ADAMTS/ADAMTS-like Spacer 1 domain-containing protein n=1 Tax=Leptidea sinapis TaxID=189913 RepID=A0A5E4QI81_9NEOP|nr:unnamed protein product [Leptidea sinapis]
MMANVRILLCVHIFLVVGREGVLASTATRDMHCGRRLVSGLFSRPRLPLGYSYVTTVPNGACRLNVTEIVSSENYIALRVLNGSYIVNGDFAVSAPGSYEAAGARFIYSRSGGLDSIFAMGPIHQAIDIMVLYTQPRPNIKYEYLTDSLPDENSNDIPTETSPIVHHTIQRHHRHHNAESHTRAIEKSEPKLSRYPDHKSNEARYQNELESNVIGDREFIWKIISYTQCSRTCGGGLQIGKFKCVEIGGKVDREVSPAHCTGSPPSAKRRRCGAIPCPPRWRAAAWGPCPVCGPAHRTRIVGCVQDHARGITKISDQKCPLPMPPNSEPCDIPNCDGSAISNTPRLDARRQVRPKDHTETFREGPIISLATNVSDNDQRVTRHQSPKIQNVKQRTLNDGIISTLVTVLNMLCGVLSMTSSKLNMNMNFVNILHSFFGISALSCAFLALCFAFNNGYRNFMGNKNADIAIALSVRIEDKETSLQLSILERTEYCYSGDVCHLVQILNNGQAILRDHQNCWIRHIGTCLPKMIK